MFMLFDNLISSFSSLQYIVLVIVVFVLQTIGGIIAFTYREEVAITINVILLLTRIDDFAVNMKKMLF